MADAAGIGWVISCEAPGFSTVASRKMELDRRRCERLQAIVGPIAPENKGELTLMRSSDL